MTRAVERAHLRWLLQQPQLRHHSCHSSVVLLFGVGPYWLSKVPASVNNHGLWLAVLVSELATLAWCHVRVSRTSV